MAKSLTKGQTVSLPPTLRNIVLECGWKAPTVNTGFLGLAKHVPDTDLELGCLVFDRDGARIDHIYSPLYQPSLLAQYGFDPGKVTTADKAIHHRAREAGKGEAMTVAMQNIAVQTGAVRFFIYNCDEQHVSDISLTLKDSENNALLAAFMVDGTLDSRVNLLIATLKRADNGWNFSVSAVRHEGKNFAETLQKIESKC